MKKIFEHYEVNKFEEQYGYKFKNPMLLCEALTHTSYANEYHQKTGIHICHNERLEFLGDSVMGTIVSAYIFNKYREIPEGKLSRMRSAIVCEGSLAQCFIEKGMTRFLKLGKGEELTGGRSRPSILSDCFEAIIGAVYLDGGFYSAEKYVIGIMADTIEKCAENYTLSDAKTLLQELLRKEDNLIPVYELIKTVGPDHDKHFVVRVKAEMENDCGGGCVSGRFNGLFGEGTGSSKKDAEQKAAADFINKGKLKNE